MPLWVVSGVAGSGKTSLGLRLADRLACPFVDADAFQPPANVAKMRSGTALTEADRQAWLDALCAALAALHGGEAVLAFPGLKRDHRARVRACRPDARFAWLRADGALVGERLRRRGGFFPAHLAPSQFRECEPEADALDLDARLPLEDLERLAFSWARPGGPLPKA